MHSEGSLQLCLFYQISADGSFMHLWKSDFTLIAPHPAIKYTHEIPMDYEPATYMNEGTGMLWKQRTNLLIQLARSGEEDWHFSVFLCNVSNPPKNSPLPPPPKQSGKNVGFHIHSLTDSFIHYFFYLPASTMNPTSYVNFLSLGSLWEIKTPINV